MDSLAYFQVITEERGLNLDKVKVDMLGNAKKVSVILPGFVCTCMDVFEVLKQLILLEQVTISLDDTIILHGGGDKKMIEERCEQVSESREEMLIYRGLCIDSFICCSHSGSVFNI